MKKHSKTLSDTGKRQMIEQGMNVVAGIDLGDKHSHICLINLNGEIVESRKIRTSQPALEKYLAPCTQRRKQSRTPTNQATSRRPLDQHTTRDSGAGVNPRAREQRKIPETDPPMSRPAQPPTVPVPSTLTLHRVIRSSYMQR